MYKKNAQLARSRAFCSDGVRPLANCLDDQGADCQERHRDRDHRNRGHRKLLLPPARGRAGCLGQGGHDPLLDANRSHAAAQHLALGVDSSPELHFRLALDFAGAHHVDFAIKPIVQQAMAGRSVERNLAIIELLVGLFLPLNGLVSRDLVVSFETSVIKHHAYFSSSSCWSASRARCTRIFSAPTVVSSNSAISSYDLPSTCFITNASRSEGASLARANCRSVRSSLRSISSSGVEYVEG